VRARCERGGNLGDIDADTLDDVVVITKSSGAAAGGTPSNAAAGLVNSDCPVGVLGDGDVGILDFLVMLGAWGPNPGHVADLDGDGTVGITDFLLLLGAWGPCPGGEPCCDGDITGG